MSVCGEQAFLRTDFVSNEGEAEDLHLLKSENFRVFLNKIR